MTATAYEIEVPNDFEVAVMTLLKDRFPELRPAPVPGRPELGDRHRVGTETPADLSTIVTSSSLFVRVTDIGVPSPGRLEDAGQLDVDVFGRSRNQVRDMAVAIQALMEGYPIRIGAGESFVLLDKVITSMKPQRVPWQDAAIRRMYASYRISARR